jgi:hypothetical protein
MLRKSNDVHVVFVSRRRDCEVRGGRRTFRVTDVDDVVRMRKVGRLRRFRGGNVCRLMLFRSCASKNHSAIKKSFSVKKLIRKRLIILWE